MSGWASEIEKEKSPAISRRTDIEDRQARGATAVGLDIADAMVAEASRRYPAIEFRQGAAESLPFGDAHFDAVVSALGMPHFADHQAFFRESHRTLRSNGRLALATWKQPDKNPFAGLVLGLDERLGV